jgi:hypothetical protein
VTASPFAADVDAFTHTEEEFIETHGEEARQRWTDLGASPRLALYKQQADVIARIGDDPRVWDALEWEVKCRIGILSEARQAARAGRPQ